LVFLLLFFVVGIRIASAAPAQMPLSRGAARIAVEAFIEECRVKTYVYSLRAVDAFDGGDGAVGGLDASAKETWAFRATWSRPRNVEPIPRAVAYCTYYVSASSAAAAAAAAAGGKSNAADGLPRITYRVENETHVHRPEENLTFSETWIDRVIARKLQLHKWIDMATPFDTARIREIAEGGGTSGTGGEKSGEGSKEGKVEDSAAAAADALDAQLDREELMDSERQLIDWFDAADADGKGYLNAQEFYMLVRSKAGDLGLTDDEIAVMLSYADENEDGVIEYKEFVPMAAEMMQNVEARRLAVQVMQDRDLVAEEAANRELYSLEMQYTVELILTRLASCDPDGTGIVSRGDFYRAISHRKIGLMRHEINLVMSNCTPAGEVEGKSGDGSGEPRVNYGNVMQLLLAVRHHTARQAVLSQSQTGLEKTLMNACMSSDPSGTGMIRLVDMKAVLANLRGVLINRLQLYSLLADAEITWDAASECDVLDYQAFVPRAAVALQIMFDPIAVSERTKLVQRAEVQPVELLDGRDRSAIEAELGALFQKFDADGNGFLDRGEFRRCLQSTELKLSKEEVAILMNAADADQNKKVDYAEFIEFAYNILLHLARERALKKLEEGA
jgi:Ca2+-binding EF-hand superfamily protein